MELPTQFLREVLKSVLKDIGLEPESQYECQQISAHLLLSLLYRVTVHYSDKTKNFIFKTIRPDPAVIDRFGSAMFFQNEIMFYERVVTAFQEFQKHNLEKNNSSLGCIPRCYKTICNGEKDVIVLENLEEKGYITLDRFKMLEVPELLLVATELGRFHAISLAIKDKDPDMFADLKENSIKEAIFCEERQEKAYKYGLGFSAVKVVELVKEFQPLSSKYVTKLEAFATQNIAYLLQNIVRPKEEDEKYNVFTHGDLWVNNLLFHYRNAESGDPKIPDKLCFVDFQRCRYGSVALDVSAVLFLLMNQKTRERHRDEFLQAYYRSVSEFLVDLDCEPEDLFPFSALENQLSKYSLFNLAMAFFLPYWMHQDGRDDDEDFVIKDGDTCSAGVAVMEHAYLGMSDDCFQMIVDVIKESVDRGYLV
jgi:hypothetical protein